jgi:alpha-1,4-digalacturonate transport system permease protein
VSAVSFLTRTRGRRALDWTDWLSYAYLTLGLFLMFGPVLWLVMSSFKTEAALTNFAALCPMARSGDGAGRDKPSPVPREASEARCASAVRRIGLTATTWTR